MTGFTLPFGGWYFAVFSSVFLLHIYKYEVKYNFKRLIFGKVSAKVGRHLSTQGCYAGRAGESCSTKYPSSIKNGDLKNRSKWKKRGILSPAALSIKPPCSVAHQGIVPSNSLDTVWMSGPTAYLLCSICSSPPAQTGLDEVSTSSNLASHSEEGYVPSKARGTELYRQWQDKCHHRAVRLAGKPIRVWSEG